MPRWLRAGSLVLLVLLLPARAPGRESTSPTESRLYFARWKVEFLSRAQSGAVCWLPDAAGNIRAEILIGRGGLGQLLDWSGPDGWTVIAAASGDGTMSRWYEEWRPVDPELDVWIRFLPAVLEPQGPVAVPASVREMAVGGSLAVRRGPFATIPAVETYQVPSGGSVTAGRRGLPRRGLGRGGPGAVVRLWRQGDAETRTVITSSRYAGRLMVFSLDTFPVTFDAAAFLPWWPLRDALTFP